MKHFIPVMFAVAAIGLPIGALAGEPPAPPDMMPGMGVMIQQHLNLTPSQAQAFSQIMDQTHQQMEQLHQQARAKVLGALTPTHRQLLAQVVGNLAVAANPDRAAAVKQLDAALSPGEAQAVLSAHNAAMQQMQQIMNNTHQRIQSLLTPQQRAQESSEHPGGPMGHDMMYMHPDGQLTAGEVLLHFSEMDEMRMQVEVHGTAVHSM